MNQPFQTTLAVNPVDILGALFAVGMVIWYLVNAARENAKEQKQQDEQRGRGYSTPRPDDEDLTVEEIAERRREELRRQREAASQPQAAGDDRRQAAREAYERRMRELREAQARQTSKSAQQGEQPSGQQRSQPTRPIEARVNTPAQKPPTPRHAPVAAPPTRKTSRSAVGSRSTAASTAGIGAASANRRTNSSGSPITRNEAAATRRSRSSTRGGIELVPMPGEEMPDRESLRRLLMWKEVLDPPMAIRPFDDRQTL